MENFISKTIFNLYERVFQEKISSGTLSFFKNLIYVAISQGIFILCFFIFQVLGGRMLSPGEYGKYALVYSVAMFLHIPMVFGISTAAVKYNAEKEDYERQRKIISTSYLMIFALSLISVLVLFLFSSQLSKIFAVSSTIFYLATFFALFYTLYILTTNTLRSLHEMKKLSIFQAGFGLCILIVFGFFMLAKYISFKALVFSIYFAYLIIFILITVSLRKYLSFHFDKFWANKFIKYGMYATIGGISFAFLPSFSKLLVNKYLTTADVGIYNAYYFSSVAILSIFLGAFITVFFPMASKYQQKSSIFKKIDQFLPYLFLLGIPIFFGIERIVLAFYGAEYPVDYSLMLGFALATALIISYGLYDWLFASQGMLGIKLVAISAIIIASVNVLLSLYLIPRFALQGAITAINVSYLAGLFFYKFFQRKILW